MDAQQPLLQECKGEVDKQGEASVSPFEVVRVEGFSINPVDDA